MQARAWLDLFLYERDETPMSSNSPIFVSDIVSAASRLWWWRGKESGLHV